MAKASNVVQETSNYEQFSFIDNNREVLRGHVENLKEAFQEIGNLTKVQPILVNERYQIIDGQHRFMAAKELGMSIHFTVAPGIGIREARSMNILHTTWNVKDFTRSYALGGDTNYQKYLNLLEDYGYTHSITLQYVKGADLKGMFKEFRQGGFVMEDEAGARERLDKLAQVNEITDLARFSPFAASLIKVLRVEGYSHRQMLNKMALHPELLKRYGTIADNMRMLEEIYNYKMHENNRLRLY